MVRCWKQNSTGVAAKLNRDKQDRSIHGLLVDQIKSLLQEFRDTSMRRTANGSVHVLAKEGYEDKSCNQWLGVAPDCARNQLVLDSFMN
jgi:hypothetical protein